MAQIVKLRRSSVSGQKPTNTNLQLGELAQNTTDGKIFLAKSGSGGPSIEEIIVTNTSNTGSINLLGSVTASNFTGSFIGDGALLYNIPASGVTGLQLDRITSGNVSASISPATGLVINTGVTITGSISATEFTGSGLGLTNVPFHISGSDVDGGTYDKQFTKLQFDDSTGLNVSESVAGTAFISIGSHFRDIFVSGSDMLRATGSDAFEIIPEGGIEVTTSITDTNSNGYVKELRLSTTTLSSSLDTRIDNLSSSVVYQSETSSMTVLSSSYALTASFALNAGAGNEGRTFVHVQSTPSTYWIVTHNLGEEYPAITVYDSLDNVVVPSKITTVDETRFTVEFSSNQTGRVSATVGGGLPFVSASFVDYVLAVNNDVPYWKGGIISGSSQIILTGTTGYSAFSSSISSSIGALSASIAATDLLDDQRLDAIESTTSSLNSYTSSTNGRLDAIEISTGSLNTFSSSTNSRLNSLETASGSIRTDFNTFTSSYTTVSSSLDSRLDVLETYSSSQLVPSASMSFRTLQTDVYCKNTSGYQINKGQVVRIVGSVGDNPLIATASYENDANSANTLGIATENIPNDSFGMVITEGVLLGVNTSGMTGGDLLYLGANGSFTTVSPTAPLHGVRLGEVLRVQQNNGSIYVRIDNGIELNEAHDVAYTSISSGDLLVRSGSVWINSKQLTGSYHITGSINATSLTGSIDYNNLTNVPTLVSGSSQVLLTGTTGYSTFSSSVATTTSNIETRVGSIETKTGSYATTGSNLFIGTQTLSGSILPSVDNLYDLGSATHQWRDVYISSGSLYVDGAKVISSTTQELQITTDLGQSIKILEGGTDSIILQTADGDIELKSNSDGDILLDPTNGKILLKGTVEVLSGNKIQSSVGGTPVVFANDIVVSGSIELTGTIDGIDLSLFSSSVNTRLTNLESSGGSLNSFTSSANTRLGALETESGSIRTAFNSYTSSANSRLNSIETSTGSLNSFTSSTTTSLTALNTSTASLNSFTSSANTRLGALETESGSIRTAFNSYTSSNDSTNTTQNSRLNALETSTSSLNTFSSSTNSRLTSIETSTSSLNTFSSSTNTRLGALETESGSIRTAFNSYTSSNDGTNTTQNSRLTSLEGKTGSYATTGSNVFIGDQTITGSLYISQNLIIGGSSSIQHITSSQLNIGDNIITVNAQNPSIRFGGLAVIDSGSSPQVSGSILFDSTNDQWVFVHQNQGTITSSVFLMGPETFNNLGGEGYLTQNRLPKGSGIEHLYDSNITDTGTKVSINSNTEITGTFVVTGTALVSGSSQINHNTTTNYVANEHINHTSVSISAGNGLSGGGDISTTRTLTLDTGSAHFTGGVKSKMNTDGVISGSAQVVAALPSGTVSGSSQVLNGSGVWSGSAQLPSGVVSGSSQVSFSGLSGVPSGLVSGSSQISFGSISGVPSGLVSGSGQVVFGSLSGLPSGLVSGSSQVSFFSLSGLPSGLVSGSGQVVFGNLSGIPTGLVSGSSQVSFFSLSGLPSGLVSGSGQVVYSQLSGIPSGIVSGSSQITYGSISGIPSGIVSGSSQISFGSISGVPSGLVSGSSQISIASTTGFGTYINQAVLTTSSPTFGGLTIGTSAADSNFPFYVSTVNTTGRYTLTNPGLGFNLADNYAQLQLYGTSGAYIDFTTTSSDYQGRIMYTGGAFSVTGNMSWGGGTLSSAVWQGSSISTAYTDAKVTSINAGTGISVNATTGAVTITNTITNNNQLTNGAGYITSYTETDTLATVTARGASTSTALTLSGKVTFSSTVASRPQFPGGILGLDTGDGNFDIWGISRDYYPSHGTAANAWGLRWNGDNNDFEFVGGGTNRVILDMDGGNITSTGTVTASSFSGTIAGSNVSGNISGNASNITSYTINQNVGTGNSPTFAGTTLTSALLMGTGVGPAGNGQPTALSYGLLQGYGNFTIAGDTDGSTSEYVIITAGYGVASATAANGLAVGYSALTWKNNTILHAGNYTSYAMQGAGYSANQNLNTSNSPTFAGLTSNGVGTFISGASDYQISLQSTDTWAGIQFDDTNSSPDYIWYHGGAQTFAIGGGGSNVSGKKLHVNGGMTVGSNYGGTGTQTNGLTVEGNIVAASYVVVGGNYSNNAYNSVGSSRLLFGGGDSDALSNYYIGTNLENYGGNYTKLDLRWHTGIRMGAQPGYGGIRFFDSEDLGSVLFSIGAGDTNVRSHTNLIPSANNSYNLGSSSLGWANVYTNDLHLSNMNKPEGNDIDGTNGNWTIQEGAENLYIINNNNGKKYKISLEEI